MKFSKSKVGPKKKSPDPFPAPKKGKGSATGDYVSEQALLEKLEALVMYGCPKVSSIYMYSQLSSLILQCFASWLSMCKVEMALINISSSN